MSDIAKEIGRRIRMYRQKAGLSQNDLGELSGFHNTYIGQIERGEKNVSFEAIDKIIKALGLSYEVFFAKLNHNSPDESQIASACYDMIERMSDKNQRLIYEIIQNIMEMAEG